LVNEQSTKQNIFNQNKKNKKNFLKSSDPKGCEAFKALTTIVFVVTARLTITMIRWGEELEKKE